MPTLTPTDGGARWVLIEISFQVFSHWQVPSPSPVNSLKFPFGHWLAPVCLLWTSRPALRLSLPVLIYLTGYGFLLQLFLLGVGVNESLRQASHGHSWWGVALRAHSPPGAQTITEDGH